MGLPIWDGRRCSELSYSLSLHEHRHAGEYVAQEPIDRLDSRHTFT
jgi:hypothetical protein